MNTSVKIRSSLIVLTVMFSVGLASGQGVELKHRRTLQALVKDFFGGSLSVQKLAKEIDARRYTEALRLLRSTGSRDEKVGVVLALGYSRRAATADVLLQASEIADGSVRGAAVLALVDYNRVRHDPEISRRLEARAIEILRGRSKQDQALWVRAAKLAAGTHSVTALPHLSFVLTAGKLSWDDRESIVTSIARIGSKKADDVLKNEAVRAQKYLKHLSNSNPIPLRPPPLWKK